jgi:uncharacterized Zn-finger protein
VEPEQGNAKGMRDGSDVEDEGEGLSTDDFSADFDSVDNEVGSHIQKLATDRQFSKPAKNQVIFKEKQADSEKRFKCLAEGCVKTFSRKDYLRKHIKKHHNNESIPGNQNPEISHPHKMDQDPKKPRVYCDKCGKFFKRKESLKRHLPLHSDEKPFKCTEKGCENVAFKRKDYLKTHIKKSHTQHESLDH